MERSQRSGDSLQCAISDEKSRLLASASGVEETGKLEDAELLTGTGIAGPPERRPFALCGLVGTCCLPPAPQIGWARAAILGPGDTGSASPPFRGPPWADGPPE